jgi:oligopeptide transport system ATP-binding protein
MSEPPILEVADLRKLFPVGRARLWRGRDRYVYAVDDVSFQLGRGEVLALVGESGCGKSTLALTLMGLEKPTAGRLVFEGRDVTHVEGRELKQMRRHIQMVFQDPYESLSPLMTIGQIVAEPLVVHSLAREKGEQAERVRQAMEDAGLKPAEAYLSIRAEILNLLADLRAKRGISILFITHDLATAAYFTDRVAVMYLGRIVEIGPTRDVLAAPAHPYTRALLSVIPVPNPRQRRERIILQGDPPNPIDLPPGCRFHPRCPRAESICREQDPMLQELSDGHQAACLLL